MTKNFIKASVGLAVVLFGCTPSEDSGNPGTAGTQGTAGTHGAAGTTGGAGTGAAGTGAAGTNAAGGTTGAAGSNAAGTTGTSGTTGSAGTGPADDSVLERGKRASRDGHYIQPTLTAEMAAKMAPDAAFNAAATYTGQMYASPLYLAKGPGGKGIFIAATTNNDIKAFDDAGAPVWTRSFTNPTSGGAVNPRGVMGTPVIDPTLGADGFATIYACAPAAATAGGKMDRYELHAISANDGKERAGWPAKLDATVMAKNDGLTRNFNAVNEGQRPALSLVNGIVYIGFGGPFGDFSTYYGWIIAVDTKSPTTIGAWSSRQVGNAVWTPGGFASDGNGVIITTGNYFPGSYTAPAMWGDSEAILRITGMPNALARTDGYHPARWRAMDTDDQDFGSSSVMLLDVPGATPAKYGVTVSKDAHLYFVNAAALGLPDGGGDLVDLTLTPSNHSARVSPVAYTTATGIHVAVTVDRGPYPMCPTATPADGNLAILMGFTVAAGTPAKVTPAWCANIGGPAMGDNGTIKNRSVSPLVTTTDGKANPIIWVGGSTSQAQAGTSANQMIGVDGETGKVIYRGGNCPGIRQWTTAIAVKGHIVAGGDGKLCSWSPQ